MAEAKEEEEGGREGGRNGMENENRRTEIAAWAAG